MAYNSSTPKGTKTSNGSTKSSTTSKAKASNGKSPLPIGRSMGKIPVAGQLVDLKTNPQKAKILMGTQAFMKSQPTNNYTQSTTAQNTAYFLGLIGVSVDLSRGATYSLMDEQSSKTSCSTTSADNPNIFDQKTAKNQKKDYPTGEDKFPSPDDPFYEDPAAEPGEVALNTENLLATTDSMLAGAIGLAADLASIGAGIIAEPVQPLVEDDPFSLDFSLFG